MLTIDLPEEVERRLDELARATGRSPSVLAERAITEYIGDLEDHEAAEREIEEVRAGRSVPVPLGEMLQGAVAAELSVGIEAQFPARRTGSVADDLDP